MSSPPW